MACMDLNGIESTLLYCHACRFCEILDEISDVCEKVGKEVCAARGVSDVGESEKRTFMKTSDLFKNQIRQTHCL